MARQPLEKEQKRQQVAVRLSPDAREEIGKIAEARGTSVGAEVERLALERLKYLSRADAETQDLFDKALDRIEHLQRQAKGRWYKNLTAWSAVSEMLAHILDDARPEDPNEDEAVADAAAQQMAARSERQEIVRALGELGFAVREDPKQATLYGALRQGGLLGSSLRERVQSRSWESAAIDALTDEGMKAQVEPLFEALLLADRKVDEAAEKWSAAMTAYWQAEQDGRRLAVEIYPFGLAKQLGGLVDLAKGLGSNLLAKAGRRHAGDD